MLQPVLWSENQPRLLAALLMQPDREVSIADLAREIGAQPGNLHGERGDGAGLSRVTTLLCVEACHPESDRLAGGPRNC